MQVLSALYRLIAALKIVRNSDRPRRMDLSALKLGLQPHPASDLRQHMDINPLWAWTGNRHREYLYVRR